MSSNPIPYTVPLSDSDGFKNYVDTPPGVASTI
jgi:hypothetical protein